MAYASRPIGVCSPDRQWPIRVRLRIGLNIVGKSQMTTFRRLQGLPTYGPMAIGFPEEWARLGQEGLVVEFAGTDDTTWVGNFRPGLDGLDTVRWHPNGTHVLVASAGALWCVDPDSRASENIAPAVFNLWALESGDLLFDQQGLEFIRLGQSGVLWHTQQISWDGFQNVRLEAEQITGEAWSPFEDRWLPFRVDVETGRVDGGSYTGPELPGDAPQPE